MGIYADIIDEMKDRNQYDGMNVGWSAISPKIRYSSKQKTILSSLGISKPNTIRDIENIIFLRKETLEEKQFGKIELILGWKYLTEKRKNELMLLRRKMRFEGSRISIESSLKELDSAHKCILEILSAEPDFSKIKCEYQGEDNGFLQFFSQELLGRLLSYIKNIEDEDVIKNIIRDMKYLVAVIMCKTNETEEYECSTYEYVTYLQKLGLKYQSVDCRNCSIDITFDGYRYCLACGKRKV